MSLLLETVNFTKADNLLHSSLFIQHLVHLKMKIVLLQSCESN